jgi:hypothetical protein
VLAPLAVKDVDPPAQITVLPVMPRIGSVLTEIVLTTLTEVLQPKVLVPLTEYVVVLPGVTVIAALVAPVFHVYELAPLAVKSTEEPAHTEFEEVIESVGKGFTVTIFVAALRFVQPAALVPFNEYVVVIVGLTDKPVALEPVLQV